MREPESLHRATMSGLVQHLAASAIARGLRVATAESCTGGLLAKSLTDFPDASAYFAGGVVAYSNDVKVRLLAVNPASLDTHGAVSKIVALEMAFGARRSLSADAAIAITGVAGPGGGTNEKPVGTIWLAVALAGGTGTSRLLQLHGDRSTIRAESAMAALRLLTGAIAGALL